MNKMCMICGVLYPIRHRSRRTRKEKRGINTVTCSGRCSKEYRDRTNFNYNVNRRISKSLKLRG